MVNTMSSRSSVCSSDCNSLPSDEPDEMDVSAGRKLSPSSMPDCGPNDHPLNLTKRKNRSAAIRGTPAEVNSSPSGVVTGSEACFIVGQTDRSSPCYRPSSFSFKTSPSKFLSSPTDDHRSDGSKASGPSDGWLHAQLGGKAVRPLQPMYNNNPASMMLSTSPSALDRVGLSVISYENLYSPYNGSNKKT